MFVAKSAWVFADAAMSEERPIMPSCGMTNPAIVAMMISTTTSSMSVKAAALC